MARLTKKSSSKKSARKAPAKKAVARKKPAARKASVPARSKSNKRAATPVRATNGKAKKAAGKNSETLTIIGNHAQPKQRRLDPFVRAQREKLLQLRDAMVDSMAGVAQEFLDGAGDQRRIAPQSGHFAGMRQQDIPGAGEELRQRLGHADERGWWRDAAR